MEVCGNMNVDLKKMTYWTKLVSLCVSSACVLLFGQSELLDASETRA